MCDPATIQGIVNIATTAAEVAPAVALAASPVIVSERQAKSSKKESKKSRLQRDRERGELKAQEDERARREETSKLAMQQRAKKKAQEFGSKGRAGTILTGLGTTGTNTASKAGSKQLLGL